MKEPPKFIHKDLSWLSFNYRVLKEAMDPTVPLYSRIRFLGIFSSNLDEFFRVKVASLRSIRKIIKGDTTGKIIGYKPKKILKRILREVALQQKEYGDAIVKKIIPELKKSGVDLYWGKAISKSSLIIHDNYFRSRVMPFLQPVILGQGSDKNVFLENRSIYLVVKLIKTGLSPEYVGYVNIPSESVPRFITNSGRNGKLYVFFLDDIIREHLVEIFPGYEIKGSWSIKLNRDAALNIEDEFSGHLVSKIKKQLAKRKIGPPSRFLYDTGMPENILELLTEKFKLEHLDLFGGGRYHNLHDLMKFPNPGNLLPDEPGLIPIVKTDLNSKRPILNIISKRDLLFHFPYHSYDNILRFFSEAAIDPDVRNIRVTFYRIASNSFIANALISAVKNGKKVIVFVEVKARFDEEQNLLWAGKMHQAGIKIIFSLPGLKVHAKMALIRRKENNKTGEYAYIGTGNFNELTAGLYTDHGLLTADNSLTSEVGKIFDYLEGKTDLPDFKTLLVSPFNMEKEFMNKIEREIEHARSGKSAGITIKVNNLEDQDMINKLYSASGEGVKIDLIVRGICCLIPGIKGLSENIQVRRIVDKFLEHARIFIFNNEGNQEIFLGSADWMERNLKKRVEVVFPLKDKKSKEEILGIIRIQMQDNTKASIIDQSGRNNPPPGYNLKPLVRSQTAIYHFLKNTGAGKD